MNTEVSEQLSIESDQIVIKAELERVLSLKRFSGAPQMSAFLRYIVTETLDGHADRIKAFSVGVDALGKPDTFDAQSDPSVRVLALRLRKTLSEVYENSNDTSTIIEMRVGTYIPYFFSNANKASCSKAVPSKVMMPTIVPSMGNACQAKTLLGTSAVAEPASIPYEKLRHSSISAIDRSTQILK